MEEIKVTSCEQIKTVNYKGKDTPIYKIGLSDNSFGESFGQEIPIGTPQSQLKIEDTEPYCKKVRWNKPGGGGGGGRKAEPKNGSFALSYAKDIVVAKIETDPDLAKMKTMDIVKVVTAIADNLYAWLKTHND